jgi:hypothetical protein
MTTPTPTPETPSETPEQRRAGRAAEYRRLALEANALGAASLLPHVRAKHEKAAETWTALAEKEERPSLTRLALA